MVKMMNVENFDSANLGELVNRLIAEMHKKDKEIHRLEEDNSRLTKRLQEYDEIAIKNAEYLEDGSEWNKYSSNVVDMSAFSQAYEGYYND